MIDSKLLAEVSASATRTAEVASTSPVHTKSLLPTSPVTSAPAYTPQPTALPAYLPVATLPTASKTTAPAPAPSNLPMFSTPLSEREKVILYGSGAITLVLLVILIAVLTRIPKTN